METLRLFATLLPLAVSSGLNLYATVLVAGLSIQFKWIEGIPPQLEILGSWPVIIIAGIFFLMEALADKIQFIDNIWDIIHTVVRPLGAMFIGFALLGQADPMIVMIAVMFAGGITLVTHGAKSGGRVALNVISPAENLKNIALSTAEDFGAGLLTVIALKYPFYGMGAAILVLGVLGVTVPPLIRWAWYVVAGLTTLVKSWGQKLLKRQVKSDTLPSNHMILLRHQMPELASVCKAQNVKGANGRTGYLSVMGDKLIFSYSTWFGSRLWELGLNQVVANYFRKGVLMDVLEIYYMDEKQKERKVHFAFLKDRTSLAEQFAAKLKSASI
jgi:hypothetical protein